MNKLKRSILLGVLLSFSLSACGIKGPLYIPEKKYPQNAHLILPAPQTLSKQII